MRFKITIDWKASALALTLLPLLLWLGNWQLDRAEQKRELKALYAKRAEGPAIELSALKNSDQMRYQPVKLNGTYLPKWNLLLDNKVYRGQFGYEVLTAFELHGSGQLVWVNRGWLKGDRARLSLPEIPALSEIEQQLKAEIYIPQGKMLQLAGEHDRNWPRVVQAIDIDQLKQELKLDMFPYTVRLSANSAGFLARSWIVINIEPAKHIGYAVQWFGLAIMAVIITVLANTNIWAMRKAARQRKNNAQNSKPADTIDK